MGCVNCNSDPTHLTVASLNYSGILTSPYEYFQMENDQELSISNTFTELVQQKYPGFREGKFNWDLGSLDTKWKNRYAVINQVEMGIKPDSNVMMSLEQFSLAWEQEHQQTRQFIRKEYFQKKYQSNKVQQRMNIQIERMRQFDLFCYKTLLKVYCGVNNFQKMGQMSAQNYRECKIRDFSKPFLNEQNKLKKTVQNLIKLDYDILFFQEANKVLIQGIRATCQNYHVICRKGSDSIILAKKKLCSSKINLQESNYQFLKKYQHQLKKILNQRDEDVTIQKLTERLNFNKDSVFQGFQNFLFINVHISSKKERNPEQMKSFAIQLKKLLKVLPSYNIICGGDFNAKINLDKIIQQGQFKGLPTELFMSPFGLNTPSVKKKRTMMQPQRNKANVLDLGTKDYIISTLDMTKGLVSLISGRIIQKDQSLPLLPNSQHPYDHYMILCELTNLKGKLKQEGK